MLIPWEYLTFLALACNVLVWVGLGEGVRGQQGITLLSLSLEDA